MTEVTETTAKKLTIYERIHLIMKNVPGVEKASYNAHAKYNYSGHEQVTAALRKRYVEYGVIRSADVLARERMNGTLQLYTEVSWICADMPESRHSVRVVGEAPSTNANGKASGQQTGVALSYAVKLAEMKLFSLTGDTTPDPEEADEGNQVVDQFLDRLEACKDADALAKIRTDMTARWKEIPASGRKALGEAGEATKKRLSVK